MSRVLALAVLLFAFPAHATVTIDWVTVGGPGNACDTQPQGCFGAVADPYLIGKYEVTYAQFTEFLNAVAATDTNGLYNAEMGSGFGSFPGGITQTGSSGSYSYSAIAGRENMPVGFISFYDSLRFANWLHNGQPTGTQDNTTTEDGAYTITAQGIADNSITRNAGATIFLTSEDEWFKAAYFNGTSYFDYPAGTDTQTTCALPGATANTANCSLVVGDRTDVGSYTGAESPYGTFDQGGNAWEWNEEIIGGTGRGLRGGAFIGSSLDHAASNRGANEPWGEGFLIGFRVAMVPEPGTGLLVMTGLLGLAGCRRGRA